MGESSFCTLCWLSSQAPPTTHAHPRQPTRQRGDFCKLWVGRSKLARRRRSWGRQSGAEVALNPNPPATHTHEGPTPGPSWRLWRRSGTHCDGALQSW